MVEYWTGCVLILRSWNGAPLKFGEWICNFIPHFTIDIKRIMYVLEWRIVSALTRGVFWCLFPELRSNEGNKYQNNTRVSAETVRHESTYIILFLTRHKVSINDDKTTIVTHRPHASLAGFSFCWWRHNRLLMTSQWPDSCDAITWTVISNSLDIDFIHGDIHGRSCKKINHSYRVKLTHVSKRGPSKQVHVLMIY